MEKIPQEQFGEFYEIITADLNIAIQSYYIFTSIQDLRQYDKEISAKVDVNITFWEAIIEALQASFIMALGRIFDDAGDTISIHKLINHCKESCA